MNTVSQSHQTSTCGKKAKIIESLFYSLMRQRCAIDRLINDSPIFDEVILEGPVGFGPLAWRSSFPPLQRGRRPSPPLAPDGRRAGAEPRWRSEKSAFSLVFEVKGETPPSPWPRIHLTCDPKNMSTRSIIHISERKMYVKVECLTIPCTYFHSCLLDVYTLFPLLNRLLDWF